MWRIFLMVNRTYRQVALQFLERLLEFSLLDLVLP
jgi:hypothetical protein